MHDPTDEPPDMPFLHGRKRQQVSVETLATKKVAVVTDSATNTSRDSATSTSRVSVRSELLDQPSKWHMLMELFQTWNTRS